MRMGTHRRSRAALGVVLVVLAGAAGGCQDKEKASQRAQLEQDNQALRDQLADAQRRAEEALARLQQMQSQMGGELSSRDARMQEKDQRIAELEAQLAAQPDPTEAPQGWEIKGGVAMRTLDVSVLFESGQAQVKGSARSVLDRIASDIRSQFADKEVLVVGHSDAEPIRKSKWRDNHDLSYARAKSVADYLTRSAGLPGTQVLAAGAGPDRPKGSNDSKGRSKENRRVEIVVYNRE